MASRPDPTQLSPHTRGRRRGPVCGLLIGLGLLGLVTAARPHPGDRPRMQAAERTSQEGSYRVGRSPYAVRLGHFDDDAMLDVVTANIVGESVSVLLSDRPGVPRVRVDTPTGGLTLAVGVGDLTGDGRDDVAAAVHTPFPHLLILEGRGHGRFDPWSRVPLAANPTDVIVTDLDLDGRLEAVVSMNADQLAVVIPDAARGAHGVRVETIDVPGCGQTLGQAADGVASGDMDGDARPDLAVACLRDWSLQVRLASAPAASGTRARARVEPAQAEAWLIEHEGRTDVELVGSVRKLRFADLDDDGFDDIVGVIEYGYLLIAWGGPDGDHGSTMIPFGINGSNTVVPADIDEDGRVELLLTSGHDPELIIIRSDDFRQGDIEIDRRIATPKTPESLAVSDLDGDGHLDLVVAGEHASAVRYLRGDGRGHFEPFAPSGG